MSRTSTTSANTTQTIRCGNLKKVSSLSVDTLAREEEVRLGKFQFLLHLQVLLWLEKNDSTHQQLSSRVERMDVNTLINSSENEAIYRQISRVVIKADLLRYEVSLINNFEFSTIRLASLKYT